jgi:hypothetical protein
MFQPNWPSSGVQVVMVKDSAAHCNAVFFPPTVVPLVILVMWRTSVLFGCPWVACGCFWLCVVCWLWLP